MEKREKMIIIANMIGVEFDKVYYACTSGKPDIAFVMKECGLYTKSNNQKFEHSNGDILLQILQDKRYVLDEEGRNEKLRRHALQKIKEKYNNLEEAISKYREEYGEDEDIEKAIDDFDFQEEKTDESDCI